MSEIELTSASDNNESFFAGDDIIETIYFGGGTPSLLSIDECRLILQHIDANFKVADNAEITLEANPDDINKEKLQGWKLAGINRLSIGVQSFFDEELHWMNRAHNAGQARQCIEWSLEEGFTNLTIDLIYGSPLLTDEMWKQNIDTAVSYGIKHLSCYDLTVEEKTPLHKLINAGQIQNADAEKQAHQFLLLMQWLTEKGYEHYEISNFALPGFRSRHNSAYWKGVKYLGLGPSAHSFNGKARQWNVSNNNLYIDSVNNGIIPYEKEELSVIQQVNEYIMISLRTIEGIDTTAIEKNWGKSFADSTKNTAAKFLNSGKINMESNRLKLTTEGKLFADGIAAEFFFT